jgi:hypothetical protein
MTAQRATPRKSVMPIWPTSWVGWASVVSVAIAVIVTIALPIITTVFGERYPATDSYAMPLIGTITLVIASLIAVLALWPGHQYSAATVVAAVVVVPLTLFIAPIVIGEGIAGAAAVL